MASTCRRSSAATGKGAKEVLSAREETDEQRRLANSAEEKCQKLAMALADAEEERDHYLGEAQNLAKKVRKEF